MLITTLYHANNLVVVVYSIIVNTINIAVVLGCTNIVYGNPLTSEGSESMVTSCHYRRTAVKI